MANDRRLVAHPRLKIAYPGIARGNCLPIEWPQRPISLEKTKPVKCLAHQAKIILHPAKSRMPSSTIPIQHQILYAWVAIVRHPHTARVEQMLACYYSGHRPMGVRANDDWF